MYTGFVSLLAVAFQYSFVPGYRKVEAHSVPSHSFSFLQGNLEKGKQDFSRSSGIFQLPYLA